jgi:Ran GTPase-activating protein (RanGAP) involved in mRNA processing and transport
MDSDDSDSDPFFEVGSASSDEDVEDLTFDDILQRVKENNPVVMELCENGSNERFQNMTDEEWEELGRDISNNTHLQNIILFGGALTDHKMSSLFRGLTRSSSIKEICLYQNELSVAGVRSMVPFLRSANNLKMVDLHDNNIQSEGINLLFWALRSSPIEGLSCSNCAIESVEIDNGYFPKHLKSLNFSGNNINADGCRGLAKLLHGGNSTVNDLWLGNNNIDDEGVAILVDALQNNSSLKYLDLKENDDISNQGKIMLLSK